MVRATLQEMLREMPQRPWNEVYAEAMHINDVIMRHARNKVEQGEVLEPGEVDQLVQAAGRAALLAKGAADIGVGQAERRQVEVETDILLRVLGRSAEKLIVRLAPHLPPELLAGLRPDVLRYVQEELRGIAEDGSDVEAGQPAQPEVRPALESGPRSFVREAERAPAGATPRPTGIDPSDESSTNQEPPASRVTRGRYSDDG